jgi:phenylacetate-CoA ligase
VPSVISYLAEWRLRAVEEAIPGANRSASPDRLSRAVAGWLSPGLVRDIRAIRLRRILDYVERQSPFYADLFRRAGIDSRAVRVPADLVQLPFTTVEDMADPNRFRCVPEGRIAHVFTTSGTTGDPKVVLFTARDLWRSVNLAVAAADLLPRFQVERPARLVALIALPQGLWIGSSQAVRLIEYSDGLGLPIGVPPPEFALKMLHRFAANTLITSPSYLAALTRDAAAVGCPATVRLIITGGELLSEDQRATFATSWGAPVLNTYGMTELGGGQAFALPGCRGLHLNEAQVLAEIVDPDTGRPSARGELVFTTLAREAMPLVRYRSGDLGAWVDCGCGLPLRAFTIEGRIGDVFVAGDLNLSGRRIAEALRQVPGTSGRVDIVVDRVDFVDRVTLRVERAPGTEIREADVRAALLGIYPEMQASLDARMLAVRIEPVERLDAGAKAYRVIDRRHH